MSGKVGEVSNEDAAKRDELVKKLRAAAAEVQSQYANYNAAASVAWAAVETAHAAYVAAVKEAGELAKGVDQSLTYYMDERPDGWLERDRGKAVSSLRDKWSREWPDFGGGVDAPKKPDAAEPAAMGHADALEALPTEPE
jgi:hypothetical protein